MGPTSIPAPPSGATSQAKRLRLRRRRFLWLALVLLAAAGGFGAYWYQRRDPAVPIQTEKVTRRNLTEVVLANGRIQPVLQVKISPEASGEIIALPVKEGQVVKRGDLLVKIKPDTYLANLQSEEARFRSTVANHELAVANLKKAEAELRRNEELARASLISESAFLEFKTARDVAAATASAAAHQVDVARAALSRAQEELKRTTIVSPLDGIIIKLNSEVGERVVGTAMMTGTEIMVIANLEAMEARVDIGELDVVLIQQGQKVRLDVDAFREREFIGRVTEIANSSQTAGMQNMGGGAPQDATRFEVRVRFEDKEAFRPGMSVTAHIETRYRTNVLSVPVQSVTTRLPKDIAGTNAPANRQAVAAKSDRPKEGPEAQGKEDKNAPKAVEVVFVVQGDSVRAVPVKRGVSDDDHVEILEGLEEVQEVVSGSFKAISRDLRTGSKIRKTASSPDTPARESSRNT